MAWGLAVVISLLPTPHVAKARMPAIVWTLARGPASANPALSFTTLVDLHLGQLQATTSLVRTISQPGWQCAAGVWRPVGSGLLVGEELSGDLLVELNDLIARGHQDRSEEVLKKWLEVSTGGARGIALPNLESYRATLEGEITDMAPFSHLPFPLQPTWELPENRLFKGYLASSATAGSP